MGVSNFEVVKSAWRASPHFFAYQVSKGKWLPFKWLYHASSIIYPKLLEGGARFIITAPPRHGKSYFFSYWLLLWYLEVVSDAQVMLISYSAKLASNKSKAVRNTLMMAEKSNAFGNMLRSRVNPADASAQIWSTNRGGMFISAGIDGGITGFGSNLAIVDDPIKNAAEAHSPTVQKNVIEFARSTLFTRLEGKANIIIVMTRWHQKDLVGFIDKELPGVFTTLNFPAVAEDGDLLRRAPGEPLVEERFPRPKLEEIRKLVGPYVWEGMYQGRPVAPGGTLFKRDWFNVISKREYNSFQNNEETSKAWAVVRRVRFWDFASTEPRAGIDPDYTSGTLMAKLRNGNVVIEDQVHGQWNPHERDKIVQRTAELDGKNVSVYIEQEGGSSGKSVIDNYKRTILKGYKVEGVRPQTAKTVRAQPLIAAAAGGKVHLIEAHWNDGWIDEMCIFPLGTHDDRVDSSSGAYNSINKPKPGFHLF